MYVHLRVFLFSFYDADFPVCPNLFFLGLNPSGQTDSVCIPASSRSAACLSQDVCTLPPVSSAGTPAVIVITGS